MHMRCRLKCTYRYNSVCMFSLHASSPCSSFTYFRSDLCTQWTLSTTDVGTHWTLSTTDGCTLSCTLYTHSTHRRQFQEF